MQVFTLKLIEKRNSCAHLQMFAVWSVVPREGNEQLLTLVHGEKNWSGPLFKGSESKDNFYLFIYFLISRTLGDNKITFVSNNTFVKNKKLQHL